MPLYLYHHPEDENKIVEVLQSMNEEHVYFEDNIQWVRVWTKPTASIDAKYDPFSTQDFIEKTGKKKGNYGNLVDLSKELSDKRETVAGKDFMKEKYMQDWSKKRNGKKYINPNEVKAVEF